MNRIRSLLALALLWSGIAAAQTPSLLHFSGQNVQAGDCVSVLSAVSSGVTATDAGSPCGGAGANATYPSVAVVAASNITLSGAQTVDGSTGTVGQTLVLATAQSTGSQNGPWIMQTGAWTRPAWYPNGGTTQAVQFATTFVRLGTTYQGSVWRQTTAAPITIGTTATTWAITPVALNTHTVGGSGLPLANIAPIATGTILGAPAVTISGVAITGTAGQISFTPSGTVVVGQQVIVSGTFGGSGSIVGYTNPTTYVIGVTNGASTATLTAVGGAAIVTTAGTPSGLTYSFAAAPGALSALPFAIGKVHGSIVLIGDSRMAQYAASPSYPQAAVNGHFFAWANALLGNPFAVQANLGVSGDRSDQFFNTNLPTALTTPSEWLFIGPPGVNDISQATSTPYTNTNNVSVTITNVATVVAGNVKAAVLAATAAGKKVILSTEWGAQNLNAAQVAQVFVLNEYLRYIAANYVNVYLWDGAKDYWNNTGSSTLIVMRTNYSTDGTHPNYLGYYNLGVSFANWLGNTIPAADLLESNQSNTYANNPQSFLANGLFTTASGGTTSGGIVVSSGTVPSSWILHGASTTSVAITQAANAQGYGNDVTLTITASAADTAYFAQAPSTANFTTGELVSAGAGVTLASGSSNFAAWAEMDLTTSLLQPNIFDLYSSTSTSLGSGPQTGYTVSMYCAPYAIPAGTITGTSFRIHLDFAAAGAATVTIRRAFMRMQEAI